MVRWKKDRCTKGRDPSGIEHVDVSFTCPLCGRRNKHEFMYVPQGLASREMRAMSSFCRCRQCSYPTTVTYKMKKTQKGLFKMKVFNCVCNGTEYTRKCYRILQPNAH